jgi:hypothetical protein
MGVIEAFGKFQIYGLVFFLSIVSFVLLGFGIWAVRKPADTIHTSKVQGTYSNVSCIGTQCTANVVYDVTQNTYSLNDNFGTIKEGDKVDVYYNPGNPSDGQAKPRLTKTGGWIMIAVALFLLLLSFSIGRMFYTASNNNRQSYARLAALGGAMSYLKG